MADKELWTGQSAVIAGTLASVPCGHGPRQLPWDLEMNPGAWSVEQGSLVKV